MKKVMLLLLSSMVLVIESYGQDSAAVQLTNLDAFEHPDKSWIMVSDISMDIGKPDVQYESGGSILLHKPGTDSKPLVSKVPIQGDVEIDVDFMMAKGAKYALRLLDGYTIVLADSWTEILPAGSNVGSIKTEGENAAVFSNIRPPVSHVAKAPGLWQHLNIKLRVPKFDTNGKVTENARFESIYLNGVLIHQAVDLGTPAGAAAGASFGSIAFSGTGGMALRNVRYHALPPPAPVVVPTDPAAARRFFRVVNPVILQPDDLPYLLRSYLMYEGQKRTHTISVGYPEQVNFSYDLKQGALLQVWRGGFMDVTNMWVSRGEPQTAAPLGAVVALSAQPTLAVLAGESAEWPDSIAFDDMHNKGYTLDAQGNPVFQYEYAGMHVEDKIAASDAVTAFRRTLSISNVSSDVYCRLAAAKSIKQVKKGMYAVDDHAYYIKVDPRAPIQMRQSVDGMALIAKLKQDADTLVYSIIW